MGFNSQDFVRIREEYSKKYLVARDAADRRREELYAKSYSASSVGKDGFAAIS